MPKKVVIHIFHADDSSLVTGSHVAERIRQIKGERGVAVEVYIFGPAEKALGGDADGAFKEAIRGLVEAGVPVHTCIDIANSIGKADEFKRHGITLEYAREAFARFALEGATVISF
jgi:hypothetical protein